MAQTINTNIASLNAQRNLTTSQTSLATSLQRLSSGLRINSAKDDAAGLAISERFSTQVRGLNQAVRNANDGISMSQTGEGALAEMSSNLQRIRELAVQSANVTNSASDRAAIDLEVQQRLAEIDRTAAQTSFNGQKILNGEIGNATFQVGANAGETISIGFSTSVRAAAMGKAATVSSGVALNTLIAGAGSPAVAGSYTQPTVTGGFDFRNITATPTVTTTGAINPGNYSSVPAVAAAVASGSVVPTNYSSIAATKATYTSGSIAIGNYSTVPATSGVTVQAGALTPIDASTNNIEFTVDTLQVDVNGNYAGTAAMLVDIQADLDAFGAGVYTVSLDAGKLSIAKVGTGTAAPVIAGDNAFANNAGIVSATDSSTAGQAANTAANKTFDIVGPGGTTMTVNLTGVINSAADMVAAITGDAQYGASGVLATDDGAGRVVLTASTAGAGSVSVTGTNASLLSTSAVDVAGTAINNAPNKTFTLQGPGGAAMTVTLNTNISDAGDMVAAITGSAGYGASGVSATDDGAGHVLLTASTAGAGSITVGGTNPSILTAGQTIVATGAAQDNSANKTLTIGGPGGVVSTFNLTGVITDASSMVTALTTGANAAAYAASDVNITASAGNLVLTAQNAGVGAIAISGTHASLLTTGSSTVAGVATSNKNAGFTVDTFVVALTTDTTDQAGLVAEIQSQLTTLASGKYSVTTNGASGFKIAAVTAGAANPAVISAYTGNGLVDFGGGTVVDGSGLVAGASLTLGAGDLSIQIGSGTAIDIEGTFDTSAKLVDAINSNVQGVFASVNATTGKLDLSASEDITLAGLNAGAGAVELAFATQSNLASGSLSTANALTVTGANDLMQRIDSALATVSTLRSTFGAVQNRFESTIASLTGTAENLTAARSRIQDTDFAMETAALTRNQILQQAGIAMLAQANAVPNQVLTLLRG